jgi:phosphatidylserine decarboxylase
MNRVAAHLFVLLQKALLRSMLTSLIFRIARIRLPAIKNFLIRRFVAIYDVNTEECVRSVPAGYATFNDFFIRELKAGARPIQTGSNALVSPADGTVSAAGRIENAAIFQAKGLYYTLPDLLATDLDDAEKYAHGAFATIYLAPYNYHRVHAPFAGQLVAMRYVPGDLYSVNTATVALMPNLFTHNERLICHFDTDAGPMILIMVGAMNVGSISTPWTGEIRPRKKGVVQNIDINAGGVASTVGRGDLLGWFSLGSTVILLLPAAHAGAFAALTAGREARVGEVIGQLATDTK